MCVRVCVSVIGSVPLVIEGFVVALSTNVFLITVTVALCSAVNGCHGGEITQDVGDPRPAGELLEHDLWWRLDHEDGEKNYSGHR